MEEFSTLTEDILNNDNFKKMKYIEHHGSTRYDHLMKVSYSSYKIAKLLHFRYKEVARAALLHDFFIDEVEEFNKLKALQKHPLYALDNAKKYYNLTDREEDIIKTHMFPVTFTPPKYLESWIVDLVDDVAGIYEQYKSSCRQLKTAVNLIFLFIINIIQK